MWAAVLYVPSGTLKVVFADIGQGDMTVITTPGGRRIVVDGGPDGVRAAGVLDGESPFWDRSVDLIVLTHPHADHVSGLTEIARRYKVNRILERRQEFDSAEYADWAKLAQSTNAEIIQAMPGMSLAFDDGVSIHVLGPPDPMLAGTDSDVDNGSVVVRVVYRRGRLSHHRRPVPRGERWMISSGQPLASDVLKVGTPRKQDIFYGRVPEGRRTHCRCHFGRPKKPVRPPGSYYNGTTASRSAGHSAFPYERPRLDHLPHRRREAPSRHSPLI